MSLPLLLETIPTAKEFRDAIESLSPEQQQELAKKADISRKYLSQIENDKVDPRFSIVQRIARALDVTLDSLGREEQSQPRPPTRQRTRKAAPAG